MSDQPKRQRPLDANEPLIHQSRNVRQRDRLRAETYVRRVDALIAESERRIAESEGKSVIWERLFRSTARTGEGDQ